MLLVRRQSPGSSSSPIVSMPRRGNLVCNHNPRYGPASPGRTRMATSSHTSPRVRPFSLCRRKAGRSRHLSRVEPRTAAKAASGRGATGDLGEDRLDHAGASLSLRDDERVSPSSSVKASRSQRLAFSLRLVCARPARAARGKRFRTANARSACDRTTDLRTVWPPSLRATSWITATDIFKTFSLRQSATYTGGIWPRAGQTRSVATVAHKGACVTPCEKQAYRAR
jgi:hypothetical protein